MTTLNDAHSHPQKHAHSGHVHLIQMLGDLLFHNVPLTVFLDVVEATGGTTIDTGGATITITIAGLQVAASTIGTITSKVCDTTIYCVTNPFRVLEAIINLQFNAMGKTSEVLVSGIQSVAVRTVDCGFYWSLAVLFLTQYNLCYTKDRRGFR